MMQSCITDYYKVSRSGEPMNGLLEKNEEYTKSRKAYHELLEQVKQQPGEWFISKTGRCGGGI